MGAVGGCLAAPTEELGDRHGFAEQTLSVRVDNESDTNHDVTQLASDAMAYWEEYAPKYAGFDVGFELTDDATPDIIVEFVDSPEPCRDVAGWSELVLGCAPLIQPGRRVTDTVRAYVVARDRPVGKVRITTKHEFGHLLGLYHTDEPLEIMSNLPEHRIPLYEVRTGIWRLTLEANDLASDAGLLHRHGVDRWNDEAYTAASAAFEEASADYETASIRLEEALSDAAVFEGHPRVETVDLPALEGHLSRLHERTILSASIAGYHREAADGAAAGDHDLVADRLATAGGIRDQLTDLDSPALRDVAVALGLVRGFDRDEPVVSLDEEVAGDDSW